MKNEKVYCRGCAHVLYIEGLFSPTCLANAEFVNGPLRPRVDVAGYVPAERYNLFNDCSLKRRFSFHSAAIKRWMLWRMNYGNEGTRIRESPIGSYPVSAENEKARKRRVRAEKGFDRGVEEIESSGGDEAIQEYAEDVLGDGGDDDSDFGGSDNTVI